MTTTTRLRLLIRKHGDLGVLVAAAYIGANRLRHRRTLALAAMACVLLPLCALMFSRTAHPCPRHVRTAVPVRMPTIGEPLFSRAKRLLHAERPWDWGGWGHYDYGWISDNEIVFAEAYPVPQSGRVLWSHLYRYDFRTGRKTHLRRLDRLVSCFYHSQFEISPDGKRLAWHGGTGEAPTLDMATLDGRHHCRWPGEYWTSRLGWARDGRHCVEIKRDYSNPSFTAIVHNVSRPGGDLRGTAQMEDVDIRADFQVGDDRIVFAEPCDAKATARAFPMAVYSLPPHVRCEGITEIAVPPGLPKPNIVETRLSPDGKRVAFVVGYGDKPALDDDVNREMSAAPTSSAFHPRSVFSREERNTKFRAYTLLVCGFDGSGMHEVGSWQEHVNPNVILDVEDFRWLPSGKSLSFFCGDNLYTVAAD